MIINLYEDIITLIDYDGYVHHIIHTYVDTGGCTHEPTKDFKMICSK